MSKHFNDYVNREDISKEHSVEIFYFSAAQILREINSSQIKGL